MIGSSLPPSGLFLGTRVLFTRDLSPHLKETLLQILALCASAGGHATPPVSIRALAQLTAKPDRTLREHIALLREQGLLQISAAGRPYQFTLHLADWLFDDRLPPQAGGSSSGDESATTDGPNPAPIRTHLTPDSLKEEEELNTYRYSVILPLPPSNHHPTGAQPEPAHPNGRTRKPLRAQKAERARGSGRYTARRMPDNLPADLRERLLSAGVFPALLHEIAERAEQDDYSPADLLALLDWCAADQPESHAALFIGRLRAGARAPAAYTQPACPRCGQRSGHAPDCPRRYLMDTP